MVFLKLESLHTVRRFFNNLSIKNKFALSCISIISISFIFLAITSIYIISSSNIEKASNDSIQNLQQSVSSIESLFNNSVNYARVVASNSWVQDYYQENNAAGRSFEQRSLIQSFLDSIIEPKSDISSIIIYGIDGDNIASSKVKTDPEMNDMDSMNKQLEQMQEYWGMPIYVKTHQKSYENQGVRKNYVSILKPIISISTGKIVAIAEINYAEATISKLLSPLYASEKCSVFIVNSEGEIISSPSSDLIYTNIENTAMFDFSQTNQKKSMISKDSSLQQLVSSVHFSNVNWSAISLAPLSLVNSQAKQQLILIIISASVAMVISIIFSIWFSKSLTKPISHLCKSMEGAGQGDFSVSVMTTGNDEIAQLSQKFNNMIQQISTLIDQVYTEKNARRESQLLALQAQINPHFLYNTLESISSLISLKMTANAQSMIKSLELFYKTSLSGGKNIITLEKEIQNITTYLKILKIRYGDNFDYQIDHDDSLNDCLIAKLSVQPLVENAIYHGVRQKKCHGLIKISCRRIENDILISVSDNGPGFDKDLLPTIFEHSATNSYGLFNVNERIQLYFGSEYGLSITRDVVEGAEVNIHIPVLYEYFEDK